MADKENSLGININRVIKEQKVVTNDWKSLAILVAKIAKD